MRGVRLTRRRCAFWVGLGLFQWSEKLRADGLDRPAAKTMDLAGQGGGEPDAAESIEHWSLEQNASWRWYQREQLVDGKWRVTGITTPISKATGAPGSTDERYLNESLVPREVRDPASGVESPVQSPSTDPVLSRRSDLAATPSGHAVTPSSHEGQPDPVRKARHGRPPSRWLRSLRAGELRIWLRRIRVNEARVEGMTYLTHLTRDHSFDADHIRQLSVSEQAKLHAAAHAGY